MKTLRMTSKLLPRLPISTRALTTMTFPSGSVRENVLPEKLSNSPISIFFHLYLRVNLLPLSECTPLHRWREPCKCSKLFHGDMCVLILSSSLFFAVWACPSPTVTVLFVLFTLCGLLYSMYNAFRSFRYTTE
ncbi:hypothetical protein ARMGADRAFT_463633 [Armillaria gallica]|uniref:Uncharacterized protein n=1 Tax=Armillaria gallica TaxID=47427 RepID=A0A2H3DIL3_ARMGA|nr:hypothetical protein ARMGADRAFT_463633 [Armillaria gallica]